MPQRHERGQRLRRGGPLTGAKRIHGQRGRFIASLIPRHFHVHVLTSLTRACTTHRATHNNSPGDAPVSNPPRRDRARLALPLHIGPHRRFTCKPLPGLFRRLFRGYNALSGWDGVLERGLRAGVEFHRRGCAFERRGAAAHRGAPPLGGDVVFCALPSVASLYACTTNARSADFSSENSHSLDQYNSPAT